jgi:hypothetical protein
MTEKKVRKGWLRDPRKPRVNETIGGGYFVFRRGDGTNRIRMSQWPFEHATFAAAYAEAEKLAEQQPGKTFDVVCVRASVQVDRPEVTNAE